MKTNSFSQLENFRNAKQVRLKNDNTSYGNVNHLVSVNNKVELLQDDPFMKWPLRGLAYTNEVGEIIRPLSGTIANLLWIPAIGYIAADVGDKYLHGTHGKDDKSKKRATKQLAFQTFASVLMPTAAVKLGQKTANILSAKGATKLTINDRASLTESIIESLDRGAHERFVDASTGLVDRAKYSEHIISNLASKEKHAKTARKLIAPFDKIVTFLKRPFETKPTPEAIKNYVSQTVDDVMNMREALLSGHKPKNVSNKLFATFVNDLKSSNVTQNKSAAFNIIKKVQNKKIFKNNALKSLGGLIALAALMKPIDNFVEHVLIAKCISPTINVLGSQKFWKSLPEIAKEEEKKESAA